MRRDDADEPRAGVCWPCPIGTPLPHPESTHNEPCASFSTVPPRQRNDNVPSYYFFKQRDAAPAAPFIIQAGGVIVVSAEPRPVAVANKVVSARSLLAYTAAAAAAACPSGYYYHKYDDTCRMFQQQQQQQPMAACPPLHPSCVASIECQCLCPIDTEWDGSRCTACRNGTRWPTWAALPAFSVMRLL